MSAMAGGRWDTYPCSVWDPGRVPKTWTGYLKRLDHFNGTHYTAVRCKNRCFSPASGKRGERGNDLAKSAGEPESKGVLHWFVWESWVIWRIEVGNPGAPGNLEPVVVT